MKKTYNLKDATKALFEEVIAESQKGWHKLAAEQLGLTVPKFRKMARDFGLINGPKKKLKKEPVTGVAPVEKAIVKPKPTPKRTIIQTVKRIRKKTVKKRLTPEQREQVVKYLNALPVKDIAKKFGVDKQTVYNIKKLGK